jgi:L-alanine-DL-glutamate epimerase-like enolase superfamily enzyme
MVHPSRSIERLDVRVCRLPTETPQESDGTATWDATTMVIAEARSSGVTGIGYTYVTAAAAAVIGDVLAPCVVGEDPFAIPQITNRMLHAIRNDGRRGVVACAISAVDIALWDLKARMLELPLASLLGVARTRVPVYASGGFTSSGLDELAREVEGYVAQGHRRVKIKIGRDPDDDLQRVRVLSGAAGPGIELMVDANGAYTRKQALAMADDLAQYGVTYFEEPVTSDDLEGLHLLTDRAPMSIAAGEYGYDELYFRRMLEAEAVDILQADATRCLGITGFLHADALCTGFTMPLASHCAPTVSLHASAAARQLVHLEYFRDHVRMEDLLFDGTPVVDDGTIAIDQAHAGLGIELRPVEAERFAA